jgi:hypothetical protein
MSISKAYRAAFAAAAGALALMAGSAANAAALLFQFDPANSSISVDSQGHGLCLGCHVTADLDLPTSTFSIEENSTQSFDFATFDLSGLGFAKDVKVTATLAFLQPAADPATSHGKAFYGTVFGYLNAGKLTWDAVPQIVAADGSTFTVVFEDLKGLALGCVEDHVSITVDSVVVPPGGVPEPASWALMIGGFGAAGALLRRRQAFGD